jgi:F-type H+-transporting ATPase subunit epsilon
MPFHFELVSPERLLFSGEVDQVDVPGAEGDFGVLAGHAPLVSTLRPGILTVINGGQQQRIVVFGGFAEVSPQGLTVLADSASAVEDLDAAALAARLAEAERGLQEARNDADRERRRRQVDQLREVQALLARAPAGH